MYLVSLQQLESLTAEQHTNIPICQKSLPAEGWFRWINLSLLVFILHSPTSPST